MTLKRLTIVLFLGFMLNVTPHLFAEIVFGSNVRVDDTELSTYEQYHPSIAVDANGNIYVAWEDWRNDNPDIYFTKSLDGGTSFEPNIRVDDTGSSASFQTYSSIAVDANGNIYVVWEDLGNFLDYDIYFAKSTDGGISFESNVRVNDDNSTVTFGAFPTIAVDINGNIYVVWQDRRNDGSSHIYFAKSTDGGIYFEPNIRVDDSSHSGQGKPSIAVDANGNIYVAWEDWRNDNPDIYFSKSTDEGASFEPNVRVDDTGSSTGMQNEPSVTVDTNGNIYVVWHDYRNNVSDIYFSKSTDGGTSFEPNLRINDHVGSQYQGKYNPSIAVDANGNIYVAWEDRRNSLFDNDIYSAVSTNGGVSFEANVQVDDTLDSGHARPSIAVDTNGNIYVAWEDWRNDNPDIYFAKGVMPNEPPILETIGDHAVDEGQLLEFAVNANDSNQDPLVYSANNLPPGADFNPDTKTFSWTPTYEQARVYPDVLFEVTDGDLTDWEYITITVNNVNFIEPTAYIDSITPNPALEGELVTLVGHGEDQCGEIVDYNWRSSIDGNLGNGSTLLISTLSIGTHTIFLKVKDNENTWSDEVNGQLIVEPGEKGAIYGKVFGRNRPWWKRWPKWLPLEAATVEVRGKRTGVARAVQTDENGNYRIENLPQDLYKIKASKDGYRTRNKSIFLKKDKQKKVIFRLK